jgi:hypothetical protein
MQACRTQLGRVPGRVAVLQVLIAMSCTPCRSLPKGQRPTRSTEGMCAVVPDASGCYPDEPRCLASDPNCGPEPPRGFSGCYRSDAKRTVVLEVEMKPLKSGCRHDGDCRIVGCGNSCAHYRALEIVTDCLAYRELEKGDALCGCVDNRCAFFTQ